MACIKYYFLLYVALKPCRRDYWLPDIVIVYQGSAKRMILEANGDVVTWAQFQNTFYGQYFPSHGRLQKQQ